ncbi:hypothetical protein [Pseudomonas sp.]|uniref:hypothetical protein n=1 Tax=Pseudomonas sp. TaxID=306 RepID=UPI003FD775D9
MKYVTFLVTLALMAGCKGSAVPDESTPVPPARLFGYTERSDALLVVGATSLGNDCTIRLSIDGKPAADFFATEMAHFGLTIGSHSLSAHTSAGCSKQWIQEVSVSVKAGDALIMYIDNAGLTPVEL